MKINYQVSNRNYHIQDKKDMQHKNVNMSWDNQKYTRHPVAAKKFKMRGSNTFILNYHYRVDPKHGKYVCAICRVPCTCPACVDQLDKYFLPNCAPSYQPSHLCLC